MALKRRTKINAAFSMASMTDVIFLLLIFFMVTSTVVVPNAIERMVTFDEITPFLQEQYVQEPEMFVALYADETVPYKEIVKVLNIANENKFKVVLATRPPSHKP